MKKFYLTTIFLLTLAGIVTSQFLFDKSKAKTKYNEPLVLKSNIIKHLDLGLHNAAADISWLAAIQYFGGGKSNDYQKIDDYLYLSSELDAKFSYPYAFGVLILPGLNQIDTAINLGKKGIEEAAPDWQIPYYLATIYYLELEDKENAAKYFDIAANTKDAPSNAKYIAANFGSRTDKREETKQIWLGIYENTKDEVVKERAQNYIIHYEILTLLEDAAIKYQEKYGKMPQTAEELVPSILKEVPNDPFGFNFVFNDSGKAEIKFKE